MDNAKLNGLKRSANYQFSHSRYFDKLLNVEEDKDIRKVMEDSRAKCWKLWHGIAGEILDADTRGMEPYMFEIVDITPDTIIFDNTHNLTYTCSAFNPPLEIPKGDCKVCMAKCSYAETEKASLEVCPLDGYKLFPETCMACTAKCGKAGSEIKEWLGIDWGNDEPSKTVSVKWISKNLFDVLGGHIPFTPYPNIFERHEITHTTAGEITSRNGRGEIAQDISIIVYEKDNRPVNNKPAKGCHLGPCRFAGNPDQYCAYCHYVKDPLGLNTKKKPEKRIMIYEDAEHICPAGMDGTILKESCPTCHHSSDSDGYSCYCHFPEWAPTEPTPDNYKIIAEIAAALDEKLAEEHLPPGKIRLIKDDSIRSCPRFPTRGADPEWCEHSCAFSNDVDADSVRCTWSPSPYSDMEWVDKLNQNSENECLMLPISFGEVFCPKDSAPISIMEKDNRPCSEQCDNWIGLSGLRYLRCAYGPLADKPCTMPDDSKFDESPYTRTHLGGRRRCGLSKNGWVWEDKICIPMECKHMQFNDDCSAHCDMPNR